MIGGIHAMYFPIVKVPIPIKEGAQNVLIKLQFEVQTALYISEGFFKFAQIWADSLSI